MDNNNTSKMGIGGLLRRLLPFVTPYRWLLVATLVLTFVGSLMAQVNAVVLDRAVDKINALLHLDGGFQWSAAARILLIISAVLLGKEVLAALVTFGQRVFGEKIRINVSRDLSLRVVDRILTFRMAFFSQEGNEPGKLQTRIDRGIMSLSNTVKNFFIDILPLFTSAVLALVLMYAANVYVGLVATAIIPVYFWITAVQGRRMKGWRHRVFGTHQQLSHGILNIIESMGVIKSFNRERVEADKQAALQEQSTDQQMQTRRISFLYEGLKTFVEQIGTVLIIILTAYLVLIDYPGMSIGKIMYHVMLFANVSAPIRQLHRIYDDLNDALVYAEGFFGLLDADGEVEESGDYRGGQHTAGRLPAYQTEGGGMAAGRLPAYQTEGGGMAAGRLPAYQTEGGGMAAGRLPAYQTEGGGMAAGRLPAYQTEGGGMTAGRLPAYQTEGGGMTAGRLPAYQTEGGRMTAGRLPAYQKVQGRFELKDVEFTYPSGTHALRDLTMTIEPGRTTALVGLSGAGKSTIVNLLDKFYAPDSGTITLDGVPLAEWDTQVLRDNIGLVLQKNHIFSGTIEENIRYGRPDATHDEVVEAAHKAYIYDQVMALPDGFGSNATQLSGGQQQRIAIARMFLKDPPIIFLDEPTASLDAIATEQIKNSIDAIKQGRTVIVISHNIGQIIDSDAVYVLDTGHVVQHGRPDEVYRQGGLYKDIFDASARSMNVDKIADTLG